MKENERTWKNMKEHERTWKNMKEHERTWKKMKENEGKWQKMTENERTWKKMTENERKRQNMKEYGRTWKNMEEHERKWRKMKENEGKWQKMKEHEKMKKMKKWKKRKNVEKWCKKKEKWNKMDSDAKSSTISKVYRCCCNFFRQNPWRFPWFCFWMCLVPEDKSTTRFGWSAFFRRQVTIFIGRETKTHILPTKINEKKSLRSVDLTIIILVENYNHSKTTIIQSGEAPFQQPHSGELKHALHQAAGPTQSQLSRPMSSGHHISMEHRLRRKHLLLNPNTNARSGMSAIKHIWKKYKKKAKKKLFSSEKMKN